MQVNIFRQFSMKRYSDLQWSQHVNTTTTTSVAVHYSPLFYLKVSLENTETGRKYVDTGVLCAFVLGLFFFFFLKGNLNAAAYSDIF